MLHCDKKDGPMEHTVLSSGFEPLRPGVLDLWQVRFSAHAQDFGRLRRLLDAGEERRLDQFVREQDLHRFVIGRGLLRVLLGAYLGRDPARLEIAHAPLGKPWVDGPVQFNISHSADCLLFGFAQESAVGIDVQHIDPSFGWQDLVRDVLSGEEVNAFHLLPPQARQRAFYRCWVMKEAITKASGSGLTHDFRSFSVLDGTRIDVSGTGYDVAHLEMDENHAGARAVQTRGQFRTRNRLFEPGAIVSR